jgi:hypothetical protein
MFASYSGVITAAPAAVSVGAAGTSAPEDFELELHELEKLRTARAQTTRVKLNRTHLLLTVGKLDLELLA